MPSDMTELNYIVCSHPKWQFKLISNLLHAFALKCFVECGEINACKVLPRFACLLDRRVEVGNGLLRLCCHGHVSALQYAEELIGGVGNVCPRLFVTISSPTLQRCEFGFEIIDVFHWLARFDHRDLIFYSCNLSQCINGTLARFVTDDGEIELFLQLCGSTRYARIHLHNKLLLLALAIC